MIIEFLMNLTDLEGSFHWLILNVIIEVVLWCRWNRFRTLCDSSRKIGVVLELTADLPSEQEIERWTGEPVKALVVPTSIFLTNKKGFPVLSRAHQNVIRRFLKVRS